MICKKCQKDVPKNKAEIIPGRNKSYYFRDDEGRLWHGKICPDCYWPKGVGYLKKRSF